MANVLDDDDDDDAGMRELLLSGGRPSILKQALDTCHNSQRLMDAAARLRDADSMGGLLVNLRRRLILAFLQVNAVQPRSGLMTAVDGNGRLGIRDEVYTDALSTFPQTQSAAFAAFSFDESQRIYLIRVLQRQTD